MSNARNIQNLKIKLTRQTQAALDTSHLIDALEALDAAEAAKSATKK